MKWIKERYETRNEVRNWDVKGLKWNNSECLHKTENIQEDCATQIATMLSAFSRRSGRGLRSPVLMLSSVGFASTTFIYSSNPWLWEKEIKAYKNGWKQKFNRNYLSIKHTLINPSRRVLVFSWSQISALLSWRKILKNRKIKYITNRFREIE